MKTNLVDNTDTLKQEVGLIVGSETSTIGKAAESAIAKVFTTINTSKNSDSKDRMYLDITSVDSIKSFIKNYIQKYPGQKLKLLFLNSGNILRGDTLHRGNFFRRVNQGEKDLNTNIYNLVLVESLQREGIIDKNTKVIYNASIQILVPKPGTEDYAKVKSMITNILLSDENLDVTILALSLVKGSKMTDAFQKRFEENGGKMEDYIRQNMPDGQPTLDDISYITEKIIENKETTKGKIVCIDGGISKNLAKDDKKSCIYFDKQSNTFKNLE